MKSELERTESRKVRISDPISRNALAAILRELRYQRRRSIELAAMCDRRLARIDLASR